MAIVHRDFFYMATVHTDSTVHTLFYRLATCENSIIMGQPLFRTFNNDKTSYHY